MSMQFLQSLALRPPSLPRSPEEDTDDGGYVRETRAAAARRDTSGANTASITADTVLSLAE